MSASFSHSKHKPNEPNNLEVFDLPVGSNDFVKTCKLSISGMSQVTLFS